jgi:xanthine dehydrogenase molybdenum-binding subunit
VGEFKFIGKRTPRRDAEAKVTGSLKYTYDLEVPGMLIGRIVRSPYAFADICRIDVSEAVKIGCCSNNA